MMKDDVIYRHVAIDAIWSHLRIILKKVNFKDSDYDRPVKDTYKMAHQHIAEVIERLPSAEPDLDEWCTDCKEYDHERHCCPRWNRVIRETLKDVERKTGMWERHYSRPGVFADLFWHCSCCGYKNDDQYANVYHKFCPNCGASMETSMERGEEDAD